MIKSIIFAIKSSHMKLDWPTIAVLPAVAIWAWLTFYASFRQAAYNVATARAFGSLPVSGTKGN